MLDVQPGHGLATTKLSDGDPDGDASQPCSERPVTTPGRQRAICSHERFLSSVLGFVQVTEDSMTGADDGRTFALDKEPECVSVTGQYPIDDGSIVVLPVRQRR